MVDGYDYVGGAAGRLGGSARAINTFATGAVMGGNSGAYTAALIGQTTSGATMMGSYATGVLSGKSVGGYMLGDATGQLTVVRNAYNNEANPGFGNNSSDTVGHTFSELQQWATFQALGWNPYEWQIDEGNDTPSFIEAQEPNYCEAQAVAWDTTTLADYGSGTAADPYRICTLGQLQTITSDPSLWASSFRLARSVDVRLLGGSIGTPATPFSGTFDGNRHALVRHTLTAASTEPAGLFGTCSGSIQHLTLVAPSVTADGAVGTLVGHLLPTGLVLNSHVVEGNVTSNGGAGGGLVGQNDGSIEWSSSSANVTNDAAIAASSLGGLVGSNSGGASIADSQSYGAVDRVGPASSGVVGGLAGENAGVITRSWSVGDVASTATDAGGLIGSNTGVVLRSFARGHVSGTDRVGALVGSHTGNITDSYAWGNATGTQAVGGLIGHMPSGSVTRAYLSGTVNAGAAPEGGFIGDGPGGTLIDCHYNAESNSALDAVGNNASAAGIAGNTIVELRQQATFTNWDFAATWRSIEDVAYPTLSGG
jgi:hypothetical protein